MPTTPYPTSPLRLANGDSVGVVHLAGELFPYARTGGLGEAVNNLACYQAASGLDTAIIMPLYRQVIANARELEMVGEPFTVTVGDRVEEARLFREQPVEGETGNGHSRPRVYFIANARYFDREGLYGEGGTDYPDNHRRFAFFCLAAVTALPRISKAPIVLHAHDWHTALAPVYLRTYGRGHPFYRRISTVLSVHNAGFQGHFAPWVMQDVGLPWELFNYTQLEWYGKVNFLKGGLAFSDAAVTVSPTHAHELRTPFGGFGLHDTFVALGRRFIGIANGIDQHVWNPSTDEYITARYSSDNLTPKRRDKAALQRTFGLSQRAVPIFAMSARLTYQKGLDLILGYPDYFALDAQFIFLGAGEPRYMDALTEIAARAPGRIACEFNFTERLEHRLIAGADMCLMPSQYEPCGLTQMRAQRYGTIPVARRVGGLADTIEDGVTGFLFDSYTSEDFMRAAVRSLDQYRKKGGWQAMQREAMSRDFGWETSGKKYLDVYRRVTGALPETREGREQRAESMDPIASPESVVPVSAAPAVAVPPHPGPEAPGEEAAAPRPSRPRVRRPAAAQRGTPSAPAADAIDGTAAPAGTTTNATAGEMATSRAPAAAPQPTPARSRNAKRPAPRTPGTVPRAAKPEVAQPLTVDSRSADSPLAAAPGAAESAYLEPPPAAAAPARAEEPIESPAAPSKGSRRRKR